jgi:methionyl-tRNA formyltransferase
MDVTVFAGPFEWTDPLILEFAWTDVPMTWLDCYCEPDRQCADSPALYEAAREDHPDLIVTVGWRHLVPADIIASTPLGVVGFHSALLPEYPGRAPVPWAILRGDEFTANTMLFLTDEPDAGDIIDRRTIPVTTAAEMNRRMGETAAEMLRQHLPALLTGTAPRTPQDRTRRGPLTTADGWQRLTEAQR